MWTLIGLRRYQKFTPKNTPIPKSFEHKSK
jgi:hypothetical protein